MMEMFYEKIIRALNAAGVRYVVVGGMAMNLRGIQRVTEDLDLLVGLTEENIKATVKVLKDLGYRPRAPVAAEGLADPALRRTWITEKNMKVFSFYNAKAHGEEVDILLETPVSFEEAEPELELRKIEDLTVPLISVRHLIRMKEKAARSVDLWDIKMLRILQGAKGKNG